MVVDVEKVEDPVLLLIAPVDALFGSAQKFGAAYNRLIPIAPQ